MQYSASQKKYVHRRDGGIRQHRFVPDATIDDIRNFGKSKLSVDGNHGKLGQMTRYTFKLGTFDGKELSPTVNVDGIMEDFTLQGYMKQYCFTCYKFYVLFKSIRDTLASINNCLSSSVDTDESDTVFVPPRNKRRSSVALRDSTAILCVFYWNSSF